MRGYSWCSTNNRLSHLSIQIAVHSQSRVSDAANAHHKLPFWDTGGLSSAVVPVGLMTLPALDSIPCELELDPITGTIYYIICDLSIGFYAFVIKCIKIC